MVSKQESKSFEAPQNCFPSLKLLLYDRYREASGGVKWLQLLCPTRPYIYTKLTSQFRGLMDW